MARSPVIRRTVYISALKARLGDKSLLEQMSDANKRGELLCKVNISGVCVLILEGLVGRDTRAGSSNPRRSSSKNRLLR